ncbi:hypothetical protein KW792_00415 [Candidatus Saccharibacteria bacterium]|nr:hypothetical protein [Candidatus Saccharibacteria bacterium]
MKRIIERHPVLLGLTLAALIILITVIWLKNQDTRVKPHSSGTSISITRAT